MFARFAYTVTRVFHAIFMHSHRVTFCFLLLLIALVPNKVTLPCLLSETPFSIVRRRTEQNSCRVTATQHAATGTNLTFQTLCITPPCPHLPPGSRTKVGLCSTSGFSDFTLRSFFCCRRRGTLTLACRSAPILHANAHEPLLRPYLITRHRRRRHANRYIQDAGKKSCELQERASRIRLNAIDDCAKHSGLKYMTTLHLHQKVLPILHLERNTSD